MVGRSVGRPCDRRHRDMVGFPVGGGAPWALGRAGRVALCNSRRGIPRPPGGLVFLMPVPVDGADRRGETHP